MANRKAAVGCAPSHGVDRSSAVWRAVEGWTRPGLTGVMLALAELGSPVGLAVATTVVCIGMALRIRSRLPVLLGVLGVLGVAIAVTVVKLVVAMRRPPLPYAAIATDGSRFPQGTPPA